MANKIHIYVGTYNQDIHFGTGEILHGKGRGIHLYDLDLSSGVLSPANIAIAAANPSFLALGGKGKYLYAVNELKEYTGQCGGAVSAYAIQPDGTLALLNTQPTKGMDPCHVIANSANTHLFVSNYSSGSVSVYPILGDGSLGPISQLIQHEGAGANPSRQEGPHAHSLVLSPDERFALVADLGIDRLLIYQTDFQQGKLFSGDAVQLIAPAGSGPRLSVFHPNGRYCYLIHELSCEISVMQYDAASGQLAEIQRISTLQTKGKGNICADLHVSADGRFLYGSNRGDDSIAAYRIDQQSGRLELIDIVSSGGRTPRHFNIDPTGRYLLAGNQDSDNIVVFRIHEPDGRLTWCSETYAPTPVCILPVGL